MGGGTGAGMGTLLISKIREEYPDRVMSTGCRVEVGPGAYGKRDSDLALSTAALSVTSLNYLSSPCPPTSTP